MQKNSNYNTRDSENKQKSSMTEEINIFFTKQSSNIEPNIFRDSIWALPIRRHDISYAH